MHNAIAKCGVLKKKAGMLRRKESRFHVLTNTGGFFQAKGFAAEFESLKPLPPLNASSEISFEKGGSVDSSIVVRVQTRGQKGPPMELEAANDSETKAWFLVMRDVVELIRATGGGELLPQPNPMLGLRDGDEGWYLEPTGLMALYTLNSDRMWVVRDRREFDEDTVLRRIASDNVRGNNGSGGYPTVLGGVAAISGCSLEQGASVADYPMNMRGEAVVAPNSRPADYPRSMASLSSSGVIPQSQARGANAATVSQGAVGGGGGGGGGRGGTWVRSGSIEGGPGSSDLHSSSSAGGGSPESRGHAVGGVVIGGSGNSNHHGSGSGSLGGGGGAAGGMAGMFLAPPLPVIPSTFAIERADGEGFGGDADSLVLRRPSECTSASDVGSVIGDGGSRGAGAGAGGGGGGGGTEESGASVSVTTPSLGRMVRVPRWRGGGGGGGGGGGAAAAAAAAAAVAERRQWGCEGARRPLRLSPAMEVLQSSLIKS